MHTVTSLPETPLDQLKAIDSTWDTLTIANDFVFCKAMLNTDLCRDVLEAIIGVPIERVEHVRKQEELDTAAGNKAVRLDVYVRDGRGTVYNVEMQATNTGELPQRARYYQSLIALDQIDRGEHYKDLKGSFVIFICTFDPFKRGRRVYYFENTCRDDHSLKLDDGARTIFLSAANPRHGVANSQLDEFLDYVADGTVAGELSERLEAEVASVLDNKKWRLEYMMLEVRDQLNLDRGISIGREQGLAEGREQGMAEGREQGLSEGREQGMAEGTALGEARLSQLIDILLEQGKADEIQRVVADTAYREALYATHGIA